jgi:hypothetical protein
LFAEIGTEMTLRAEGPPRIVVHPTG